MVMKSSSEYIKAANQYAQKRLERLKEKFGESYVDCPDGTAKFLLSDGYMTGAMDSDYDTFTMKEKLVAKAVEWIRYHNENGGCSFDNWEESLEKTLNL